MASTAAERGRTPQATRGRPKSADKNRAIVDAAGALFLSLGFERTSMDEVARTAGVSKQTVYAHFVNKERLFRAVIAHKVADYFPEDPISYAQAHTLEQTLRMIGGQYLRLVLSDEAVALFRVLCAAGEGHPKMVQLFFEEGPQRLSAAIRGCLEQACARGELACDDVEKATSRLCSLLRGELHLKRLLGLADAVTPAEIDGHVAGCTRAFLRLYGKAA